MYNKLTCLVIIHKYVRKWQIAILVQYIFLILAKIKRTYLKQLRGPYKHIET